MKKNIILAIVALILGCVYSYGQWSIPLYDINLESNTYSMTPNLEGDMEAVQEFICPYNGLSGVSVKFAVTANRQVGNYTWSIIEKDSQKSIREGVFKGVEFQKNGVYDIKFDKVKNSKDKEFSFKIKAEGVSNEESIAVYTSPGLENSKDAYIGDEMPTEGFVLKEKINYFNFETFITFLGIALYLICFVHFMEKLFK